VEDIEIANDSKAAIPTKKKREAIENEIGAPASGIAATAVASPDAPDQDLKPGTWTIRIASRVFLYARFRESSTESYSQLIHRPVATPRASVIPDVGNDQPCNLPRRFPVLQVCRGNRVARRVQKMNVSLRTLIFGVHPALRANLPMTTKRILRALAWACLALLALLAAGVATLPLLLSKVPKTYPPATAPIPPPDREEHLGGDLPGFDSPYLGHTGSWDGKGGGMFGSSKVPQMDIERAMGLHWTFMPVYWRVMEPDGPADLSCEIPAAWQELDAFILAAHDRELNILMQAPVVGGNAGGPPAWAGLRQPGKAAPVNILAAAEFSAKLAARYAPNGTLAKIHGWNGRFGVRAWEIDNEPEGYRTNWKGQAAQYAELVTKAAARIKQTDPLAVILAPAMAGGGHGSTWIDEALEGAASAGTPQASARFTIGPATEVVSFHCYEGLETGFAGEDRTLERDFGEIRAAFEKWENRVPGHEYTRKREYWHTEGNFDFLGLLSAQRRAAWRWQFMTRGFAAGLRKIMVMDASRPEQAAVRAYIRALPNPLPMAPATNELRVLGGAVAAFRHEDGPEAEAGRVWVLWAVAGAGPAVVDVPVLRPQVDVVSVDGRKEEVAASQRHVRIQLKGDAKMAPGLIVVDRSREPTIAPAP
jgi:hypothetical protein